MVCPECNREIAEEARFCRFCGSELPGAVEDVTELPPAPATDAPPDGDTAGAVDAPPPPPPAGEIDAQPSTDTECPPLPVRTSLPGPFVIDELEQAGAAGNVYIARGATVCVSCGFSEVGPGDRFCDRCGAAITSYSRWRLHERPLRSGEAPDPQTEFTLDERVYAVELIEPAPSPGPPDNAPTDTGAASSSPSPASAATTLAAAAVSDCGMVRDLDEDSLVVLTLTRVSDGRAESLGLYVVADGMGGHEGGEVASRLAVDAITREVLLRVVAPWTEGAAVDDRVVDVLRHAIHVASVRIAERAGERESDMGTTVTLALVVDDAAYIANVGDSRTYHWREGELRAITEDHSLVAEMVAEGSVQPEEIYTHPQKNVITRSVGDPLNTVVDVDCYIIDFEPGDALVVCCDGLWEMVRDPDIAAVVASCPLSEACRELVRRANEAGGQDNISVIIVQRARETDDADPKQEDR